MSKALATIDSSQLELAGGWSRKGFAAGTDGLIPLTSTEPGLEAIDLDPLDCVTGGQGDINDYGDLSNLVYHGSEKRRMTPAERLNKFLYGGAMAKDDRAALIRNWEENNGRKAPPRIEGTPEVDW